MEVKKHWLLQYGLTTKASALFYLKETEILIASKYKQAIGESSHISPGYFRKTLHTCTVKHHGPEFRGLVRY